MELFRTCAPGSLACVDRSFRTVVTQSLCSQDHFFDFIMDLLKTCGVHIFKTTSRDKNNKTVQYSPVLFRLPFSKRDGIKNKIEGKY